MNNFPVENNAALLKITTTSVQNDTVIWDRTSVFESSSVWKNKGEDMATDRRRLSADKLNACVKKR
jgi:hypothetical protein